jgi:alpha-L-arabinofuranosidase
MDKMGEFVQDALDAIEYANGAANSPWGRVRAQNGRRAPFQLRYLEIGNENGGPAYHERYALIADAIKAKYPEMRLVANEWNGRPTNRPLEIVDEHYYSSPEFFIRQAGKYDSYDRLGHKIYVGEYAVTQGGGQGNLRAAVGEAAFMVGMERNSDVVVMSSYAPLFANVNYKKWNPDLINFDSSRVFGLPGYYVQQMFSRNRGDVILPTLVTAPEVVPAAKRGGIGVGTWLTQAEFKDLKVTRGDQVLFQEDFANGTSQWRLKGGQWSVKDGALRQEGLAENIRAFIGDKTWSNYTYSLKARKISGAEGFLIPFLTSDEDAKGWWNIGGWGNQRHGIEMDGMDRVEVPGHIETGRWYDIRIEVQGTGVKCFLDNKLIHDVRSTPMKSLFASASLDKRASEAILKIVNSALEPIWAEIQLEGRYSGSPVKGTVLTSANSTDENTLEDPERVSPKLIAFKLANGRIRHSFPGNSVTLLRVPVR